MGKPIWLKGEMSVVQHPKMGSRALASPAAPPKGQGVGPSQQDPQPYPSQEPKSSHGPHPGPTVSRGLLPRSKNGHLASCQTHFRKIMQKPRLWVSGSILPPARSPEL